MGLLARFSSEFRQVAKTARNYLRLQSQTFFRRLIFTFGTAACAVLLLAIWGDYYTSRTALEKQLNASVAMALHHAGRSLDLYVQKCGARCESIAAREFSEGRCPPDAMRKFLVDLLARTPRDEAFDFYIAYENMDYRNPNANLVVDRLSWPATYYARYDYHEPRQEWYHVPKLTRQPRLTEPYYDLGSVNQSMVSYTVPLLDASNQFLGVAGVDILLDTITNIVARLDIIPGNGSGAEHAVVASKEGRLIYHPNAALLPSKDYIGARLDQVPEGSQVSGKGEGFASVRLDGSLRRIYWTTAPFTGWKVVVNVSDEVLLAPINALTRQMLAGSLLTLLAMLAVIFLSAHLFSRPVRQLAVSTSRLTGEILPANEPNAEGDELAQIGRSVKKLADYQAELDQANRDLESFSYSVSHDLRAPLRAIGGFTAILQEDYGSKLDAEGRQLCDRIRGGVQDMNRLISDLLNFSKLGRAPMQTTRVAMHALAAAAFESICPAPRHAAFQLGPLPDALGDAQLLRQVWLNLLSNAVKFSARREKPVIKVTGAQNECEIVYTVRDNGAGFDPQYAAKLFGVFQRLHSASEFEGTGVGLAIVQRIIHRHGGKIWAESQPDAGAAFHFSLPMATDQKSEPNPYEHRKT